MSSLRSVTFLLLLFTLVAFAANSILCRMALVTGSMGALEFTLLRLSSGLFALLPILVTSGRRVPRVDRFRLTRSTIGSPLALFAYALFFSLAYIQLDAAIGALILFAAVQITMIGVSIYGGTRLTVIEWLGFLLAFGGLTYLLLPGLTAPPLLAASLMLVSGVAWGAYSLLGKHERYPVISTARNFLYCIPGCFLILILLGIRSADHPLSFSSQGVILALVSGGITSGMGYVLWYISLKRITTTLASVAQLAVPVIAGMGGVVFLSEPVSFRLISAAVLIIGGIVATILGRSHAGEPVAVSK